jgi:hypothetical protein
VSIRLTRYSRPSFFRGYTIEEVSRLFDGSEAVEHVQEVRHEVAQQGLDGLAKDGEFPKGSEKQVEYRL